MLLGYKFYDGFLEKINVIRADGNRMIPAKKINDGVDCAPTKMLIFFGHHLSLIEKRGLILGPLIAVFYFGWLGGLISSDLQRKGFLLFRNRGTSSVGIVLLALILGITVDYKSIWPVFGASNQLIAAFSLVSITFYLVEIKRPKVYMLYSAYFMWITTLAALISQDLNFLKSENFVLAAISLAFIILGAMIIYDPRMIPFSRKKRFRSH